MSWLIHAVEFDNGDIVETQHLTFPINLSVCVSSADEEGKHYPELPAESPGGPQEGFQWAQVRQIVCLTVHRAQTWTSSDT